jgi:hypothetical protein
MEKIIPSMRRDLLVQWHFEVRKLAQESTHAHEGMKSSQAAASNRGNHTAATLLSSRVDTFEILFGVAGRRGIIVPGGLVATGSNVGGVIALHAGRGREARDRNASWRPLLLSHEVHHLIGFGASCKGATGNVLVLFFVGVPKEASGRTDTSILIPILIRGGREGRGSGGLRQGFRRHLTRGSSLHHV